MYSCGSLDLALDSAQPSHVSGDSDCRKLDALAAMTISMWMNLRADPTEQDCLLSDVGPSGGAVEAGGWELRILGADGAPSADDFRLAFEVLRDEGGRASSQGQMSPPLNAENRWIFVAVTFTAENVQRFYWGTETDSVSQIGVDARFAGGLPSNAAGLWVGMARSEPLVDRTPPVWVDDLRVFDRALTLEELQQVKMQALEPSVLDKVPGFVALGGIPGAGCEVLSRAISADGSTVVGQLLGPGVPRGYRWHNGIRLLLPNLLNQGETARASSVSGNGAVSVGWARPTEGGHQAVTWDAHGNMMSLGRATRASDVSGDGQVIVGTMDAPSGVTTNALRLEAGTISLLGGLPGGTQSAAYGVSFSGDVIVGAADSAEGRQAVIWRWGQPEPLGDLPGGVFESSANRVSANEMVVVGWGSSELGREAACWVRGRVFGLGDLSGGSFQSEALAVSRNGSRVVGKGTSAFAEDGSIEEAFIWDRRRGIQRLRGFLELEQGLDLGRWHLSSATGISIDGSVITGYGTNPEGLTDSFVARISPAAFLGDFDEDGDVDIADLAQFTACATGPDIRYDATAPFPGCSLPPDAFGLLPADFDLDGDVDSADFAIFQRCLAGPPTLPPNDCSG